MEHIEHPDITRINKTGYATVEKKEAFATDFMGSEIFSGESFIELPDGELLLESNLEDYLIEVKGFVFKTADNRRNCP